MRCVCRIECSVGNCESLWLHDSKYLKSEHPLINKMGITTYKLSPSITKCVSSLQYIYNIYQCTGMYNIVVFIFMLVYSMMKGKVESLMGYSMRTLEFRYVMWLKYNTSACRLLPTLFREELYDHRRQKQQDTSSSSSSSSSSPPPPARSRLDPLSSDMELLNIANNATLSRPFQIHKIRKFLYQFLKQDHFFKFPCSTL
jgi:hypothetical protein